MKNILEKNNNGSIDILDEYGYYMYTVNKNEKGIVAYLADKLVQYEDTGLQPDEIIEMKYRIENLEK